MRRSTISNFDHLLKYKFPLKAKTFCSTQIMCTIDVDSDEEKLLNLMSDGMRIACFDCSKSSLGAYEKTLKNLRDATKKFNKDAFKKSFEISVATALNVKASTFMTGNPKNNEKFFLELGKSVNITNNKEYMDYCDANWIYINFPNLTELSERQIIFIGERLKFMVEKIDASEAAACCRVLKGGNFDCSMEVLIPQLKLNFPPIDKQFIDVVEFAKKNRVDIIFTAISDAFAFETIKCHLRKENRIALMAKIENQTSYDSVDKFIENADGIFISSYRLGLCRSTEKAQAAQKCIIKKCLEAGIPSIVSSKMLQNETSSAEIANIFNTTIDGCDCILLESDSLQCFQKMRETILASEQMINHRKWFCDLWTKVPVPSDISNSIAVSACLSAISSNASAIIVLTACGKIAQLIAKYRPECPIVVVSSNEFTARQCLLLHGVRSICVKEQSESYQENVEKSIEKGIQFVEQNFVKNCPASVVVVFAEKEGSVSTNVMQVVNVNSERNSFDGDSIKS